MFLFYISDWKLATKMVVGMSFVPLIVDWLSGGLPRLKSKGKWLLSFLQELKRKQTPLYTNHFFINIQFVLFFYETYISKSDFKNFYVGFSGYGESRRGPLLEQNIFGENWPKNKLAHLYVVRHSHPESTSNLSCTCFY